MHKIENQSIIYAEFDEKNSDKQEKSENMKEFLFEMHAHTSQTSTCGDAPAETVVETFRGLGYDGIVITDHMHTGTMKCVKNEPWEKKADHFLEGYRAAKKLETEDFSVLLGMELRFLENINDYLVYGFNEEFIYSHPNLDRIQCLEDFRPIADENGLIVFQAHPFRVGMTISDDELLDGVEIYNAHPGHESNNDIARAWAEKYELRPTSGSDFHGKLGSHPGGLFFPERPACPRCLAKLLRENRYRLRTDKVTE